jgi:hypothetical protein
VPIKDRETVRRLADCVMAVYARSSAHPVEYAITLRVHRDGAWRTIHLFDNAHAVDEHHEHRYVGDCKQPSRIIGGTTNAVMAAAMRKLRASWREILKTWEQTR